MMKKLKIHGVGGKLLKAVKSLYVDSRACVRVDSRPCVRVDSRACVRVDSRACVRVDSRACVRVGVDVSQWFLLILDEDRVV